MMWLVGFILLFAYTECIARAGHALGVRDTEERWREAVGRNCQCKDRRP